MKAEKALIILSDAFDEKQRLRYVEAVSEVSEVISEAEHDASELREALATLSAYDSTWTDVSLAEGIRRLRERITEGNKETSLLRGLYETSDDVITACKVALYAEVTADHQWHPAEDHCPHVRCVALNKIEELRGDG